MADFHCEACLQGRCTVHQKDDELPEAEPGPPPRKSRRQMVTEANERLHQAQYHEHAQMLGFLLAKVAHLEGSHDALNEHIQDLAALIGRLRETLLKVAAKVGA